MQSIYEESPESTLFQGDVVSKIPFIDPYSKNEHENLLSTDNPDRFYFRASGKFLNAILVSQTCDIERAFLDKSRENVLVAPVITIKQYENSMLSQGIKQEKVTSILASIRGQKTKFLFYLPSLGTFEESYADLTLISYVDSSFIDVNQRKLSLNHYGRNWFSYTLSEYLDRPFK